MDSSLHEDPPIALHDRAIDDLRFIRATMERSASFTGVPGWGNVGVGVVGVAAAVMAHRQPTPQRWLMVWLAAAAVGVLIGGGSIIRKARRANIPLSTGPGRTFLLSFVPSMTVAAAMTAALASTDNYALLPALWLLAYGAAIVSAGVFSVRVIPLMGMAFMVMGALALVTPATWASIWQALGFGGLHIGFGILIARRYGG